MKSISLAALAILVLRPGNARAQDVVGSASTQPTIVGGSAQSAKPTSAPPGQTPPPPPQQLPPPPEAQAQPTPEAQGYESATQPQAPPVQAPPQPAATGQWVYTAQYGWIWMPYGVQYTYESADGGAYPYEYVYYRTYGWTWLAAPWVWGRGRACRAVGRLPSGQTSTAQPSQHATCVRRGR